MVLLLQPGVAGFIEDHPLAKEVTKGVLYPLIGILHLSIVTHSPFGFSPELGVVTAGLVASSLIGVVYFSPLMVLLMTAERLRKHLSKLDHLKPLMVLWLISVAAR